LGFVIGLTLSYLALELSEIGHGTYAPVGASASIFVLFGFSNGLIPFVITPLIWAIYFSAIPAIKSWAMRVAAVAIVISTHLISGVFLLVVEDGASSGHLSRMFGRHPLTMVAYWVLLLGALFYLAYFSLRRNSLASKLP
jgi:hypothetical protein